MRSSCLEHHGELGRRCFFCLSKWTCCCLIDSKLGAVGTTSERRHCGQRERGKRRRHSWRHFPFHCLRPLGRSGNKDRMRSNNVKKWKVHPYKCSSVENMNWFCSLSSLLHCSCGVWASPLAHRGDFPPFTPGGGSRAPRILLSVLTQVTILALFVLQLFFCGHKAKIIAFIWCWVTDLIRKSWLKRLADFFFFVVVVLFGSFIINNVEREMLFAIVLLWIDWQVIIRSQNCTCMWGNQEITYLSPFNHLTSEVMK